jgi:hypothetical protein
MTRIFGHYTSEDLGYVPPTPITRGEEKLLEQNQVPEETRIRANQEMQIPPYPPDDEEETKHVRRMWSSPER